MRGLECSKRHPRYAVSHDPHCRCPGLSIIARFIAAAWTTKRDHWRERERQISTVPRLPIVDGHVPGSVIGTIRRECLDHVIVFSALRTTTDKALHTREPQRGYERLAFEATERARARSFRTHAPV